MLKGPLTPLEHLSIKCLEQSYVDLTDIALYTTQGLSVLKLFILSM